MTWDELLHMADTTGRTPSLRDALQTHADSYGRHCPGWLRAECAKETPDVRAGLRAIREIAEFNVGDVCDAEDYLARIDVLSASCLEAIARVAGKAA